MRSAVVVFPGSNCDHDAYHVLKHVLGQPTEFVWHKERSLDGFDLVVLPGGFAHGDYLRGGAIARFSPIMDAVVAHNAPLKEKIAELKDKQKNETDKQRAWSKRKPPYSVRHR